ncbi:MAG: hypothetical protein IT440_01460 [Phycisphaeraceae bacterium]|nr:hypothetical protein [Phycisphaeraceae bacterium]
MTTMQLDDAIDQLASALAARPDCDFASARQAAYDGKPRQHATFRLGRLVDIDAGEGKPAPAPKLSVEQLANAIAGMAGPLAMHNPTRPTFGLGVGTGTLTTCFGMKLLPDIDYQPAEPMSLDDFLAIGDPDPATSGLMPEIRQRVDLIRQHCPDWIKIDLPNLQGPFNLAHMLLGNDVFTLPMDRPGDYQLAMQRITTLFLGVQETVSRWIGPERLSPCGWDRYPVAECSVNMVSADFYVEHILPYDLRIAEAWGEVAIHTCSGPHVFHATLTHLPRITLTEAGRIPCAVTGWTNVDEAQKALGDRPVGLNIGQELPEGQEEAMIRRDLDRLVDNPRIMLGYTGMHWRCKDEPMMREMHLRLNDYYQQRLASSSR